MQLPSDPTTLVSARHITQRGDFSDSHFYELVRRGQFPRPIIKSRRLTRWLKSDVDKWFLDPSAWVTLQKQMEAK